MTISVKSNLETDQNASLAGEPLDDRNIVDLLAIPECSDIGFEVPRLPDDFIKPAVF